jgi:hypothetical protein
MSLASKRYVEKRLTETRRPIPPRRLEAPGGGGKWATDYVWVGGKRLAIPENENGYDFLRVYLNGTTSPAWIESMPSESAMPEDSEIFDMTTMQIHLPGNFGG